jgi:hypothetical protein
MKKFTILLVVATLLALSNSFKLKLKTITQAAPPTNDENLQITGRPDMPCAILTGQIYKAFQLYGLQQETPQTTNVMMGPIPATLKWNMCTTVPFDSDCPTTDPPIPTSFYGFLKGPDPNNPGQIACMPIYAPIEGNSFTFEADYTSSDNKVTVDSIKLSTVINMPDPKIPFSTVWDITCVPAGEASEPAVATFDVVNKILTLKLKDKSACGQDLSKFILFFKQKFVIPAILMLISLPLIFLGLRFIKKSLATVGFIGGIIAVAFFTTLFANFMAWETKDWIFFGLICLGVAILLAVLCYNSPNLAIILGGAVGGYFGGQQLLLLIQNIAQTDLSGAVSISVIVVCVIIGLVIGWKLKKICIILATSLSGSYLFVFSLGSLIGNYPDMKLVKDKIKDKDFGGVGKWAWIYMLGVFVLFIVGATFQWKKFKDFDAKMKEN